MAKLRIHRPNNVYSGHNDLAGPCCARLPNGWCQNGGRFDSISMLDGTRRLDNKAESTRCGSTADNGAGLLTMLVSKAEKYNVW
jgi:hypothetical protein